MNRALKSAVVVLAVAVSACGGGKHDEEASLPVLVGKLVYVDASSGKDRLHLATDSDGAGSHELVIGHISTRPAHDAGEANLQPQKIAAIQSLVWSVDGQTLAVVVSQAADQSQIIVVDPLTGDAFTASPQDSEVSAVDWSPDGRSLAYVLGAPESGTERIAVTDLASGEVSDLPETQGLGITELRWDAVSAGLYFSPSAVEQPLILHLDLQSRHQTTVRERTGARITVQDIGRLGGFLFSSVDPEFTALADVGPEVVSGDPVLADSDHFFTGWYLSSPDGIAIERIRDDGDRLEPLIAKRRPSHGPDGSLFDRYRVKAPVALKWDFFEQTGL